MRKALTALALSIPLLAHGAAPSPEGRWEGRVEIPGTGLPLVIDLARTSAGAWTGSIVIPGLGIKGAPLSNLVVSDDQVSFDLGNILGTPLGVALHPTQLYEAGAELVILIVLLVTERKGRPFPGRTFWLYMLLYAISRFIIEFYRGDDRGTVGMFSTSQFISIVLAPLAIVMLVYLSRVVTPEPKRARKAA